jgi:hypothetical protein
MNKHILLVMKWLADKNSVNRKELKENEWEAHAAADAAYTACASYATCVATCAAAAAAADAYLAAATCTDAAYYADLWVNKYFKITSEDKNEYLKELTK